MKNIISLLFAFLFLFLTKNGIAQSSNPSQDLPLSTQLTIEKANVYNQTNEILNVFLVANVATQSVGTGFLIKSGNVITNEHVVHGALITQLLLLSPNGQKYALSRVVTDTVRDLAILSLTQVVTGGFELGDDSNALIGNQVYTWGYPLGYNGPSPLLSVGYIAGLRAHQPFAQKFVKHLVVNGALNPENSGGPLINSGKVIGIVQSKATPITPYIASALQALKNNKSGFIYSGTDATGKPISFSEAQVIEQILTYYRELAQVMIGEAVSISELKHFLNEQRIAGY